MPALTVTKPGDVKDVYVVYKRVKGASDDCPDCGNGANTGDETNIAIWIALVAAAAAAIIAFIIRRRRNS